MQDRALIIKNLGSTVAYIKKKDFTEILEVSRKPRTAPSCSTSWVRARVRARKHNATACMHDAGGRARVDA
jgi:hypothetical protein